MTEAAKNRPFRVALTGGIASGKSTVADMFGWPEISYWQAIGIFVLAKFLFGFGVGGGNNSAVPFIEMRQV